MNLKFIKNFGMKHFVSKVELFLSRRRVNYLKTVYVNFRSFTLFTALRFPIYVYSDVKIIRLGDIEIYGKIEKGMIRLGMSNFKAKRPMRILNYGKLIFHGKCLIHCGSIIQNKGIIEIGSNVFLSENCELLINQSLKIGDYTRISFDSIFMDTDFHYMLNIKNGSVRRSDKPIVIGKGNWIANKTVVKKGTKTSDNTIVAGSNSLLNKDYSLMEVACPILGGSPAKLIADGWRRIYNPKNEADLEQFFKESERNEFIIDISEVNIEDYCLGDLSF